MAKKTTEEPAEVIEDMAGIGVVPDVSNAAAEDVKFTAPYYANVTVKGVADILFHAWNVEAVQEKADAAKGSVQKKTDNTESYVYRNAENAICIPGTYLRGATINAAKYKQDPRSPRKSKMDLYKAGLVVITELAPIYNADGHITRFGSGGRGGWDYDHKCRVQVQRAGITRVRPAFKMGWSATFQLLVNLPEYIKPEELHEVIANAGRLVGLGDFRPTYGRFRVTNFQSASALE